MNSLATPTGGRLPRWTRFAGLAVVAPLLLILGIPVSVHLAQRPDYGASVNRLQVVAVEDGGPAAVAGLRVGDEIIGVRQRTIDDQTDYHRALAGNYELQPVEFTVLRAGAPRRIMVSPRPVSQAEMVRSYSLWAVGIVFLAMGWWVLARRDDAVARNFFALCAIFAFFLVDVPDLDHAVYMRVKDLLRLLLQLLLPAYVLRFFLLFPHDPRGRVREPRHMRLLLAPGWALFALAAVLDALGLSDPGSATETAVGLVSLAYMLAYFIAGLVVFARRTLRRDRPIQRTKMLVILAGLLGGLVPFLAVTLAGTVTTGLHSPHLQYLALSVALVPLSFALAIMRYGALDAAFVVRVGLIYGLLTVAVVLVYLFLALVLGRWLSSLFGVSSPHVLYVVMAASGLAILPLRRQVQSWIDRAFYPARRADRRALDQLARRLTDLIETDAVHATLSEGLRDLYRPDHLGLYLHRRDENTYADHAADPEAEPAPLPRDCGLAVLLDRVRRPLSSEEAEDLLLSGEADAESLALLTRSRASLLVPLVTGNRLLGFIILGPKRGGGLYRQEDLANLSGLAVQAASVIENRRLYAAGLKRRRLETELEVARGIQAGLLPEEPLTTDDYTVCGRNEPSRTVGGDYFDYFQHADGRLAVAIADVSGKGIPAALMMTSLRVAFRREAESDRSPREVIAALNRVASGIIGAGNFICFFYGVWDPREGLFRYSNAGMEPPILFRERTGYRQFLKKGGPVLGIESDTTYREGVVELTAGDRVLLHTDGLTDQRSPGGEFFDRERLLDLVASHAERSPEAVLRLVFDRINAFGGERKTDDKTAIILEIKR